MVDYNTQRPKLIMSEYGRSIQQMVDTCKSLPTKEQRLNCAWNIISVMERMAEQKGDKEDFIKKLWNHLAAISNYELDIDYPVEIQHQDGNNEREAIPYPKNNIHRRHYGSIVEKFTEELMAMPDGAEKEQLTMRIANHMKRDLSNWLTDAMSDAKVIDDLSRYTEGKIQLDPSTVRLVSDGELLSSRVSTSVKKRKKK